VFGLTCWGHGILERCCLCSLFWWKLRCDCQSIWNQSYITDKKRWAIYNSKPIFGYNSWRIARFLLRCSVNSRRGSKAVVSCGGVWLLRLNFHFFPPVFCEFWFRCQCDYQGYYRTLQTNTWYNYIHHTYITSLKLPWHLMRCTY